MRGRASSRRGRPSSSASREFESESAYGSSRASQADSSLPCGTISGNKDSPLNCQAEAAKFKEAVAGVEKVRSLLAHSLQ